MSRLKETLGEYILYIFLRYKSKEETKIFFKEFQDAADKLSNNEKYLS